MRGIALTGYGDPDVLRLHDDLPDPVPGPDGVVIRTRAAGVNPVDWKIREDAALDYVGGTAVAQSPLLVRAATRHASVVDAKTVLAQGGRYVFVRPDGDQLAVLADLADAGKLRVDVRREYPLAEAAQAHRALQEGHGRGKIVLTV